MVDFAPPSNTQDNSNQPFTKQTPQERPDLSMNQSANGGDSTAFTNQDQDERQKEQFTGMIDEEAIMNASNFSSSLYQYQNQPYESFGSVANDKFENQYGDFSRKRDSKHLNQPSTNHHFSSQEQQLLSIYERDKFINGAIIAIRAKDFPIRKVVEVIQEIAERTITDNYIRRVWHYWKRFQKVYFSTASKTCIYTKHEAMLLYERISKGESALGMLTGGPQSNLAPQQQTTLIPYLKEVLQRNSQTKQMLISFSQFEQVSGLNSEENFMKVKDAIENEIQEEPPNWVDVSVKIMISASQFQCKKNIEFQCLAKLREIIYFKSIQWIGVVMGETLNGRGKFIYLHCRFDKNVAKKKKHLKRFLLELIPTYFYSHNCVNSQKVQILNIKRFQKIYFEQCMQQGISPNAIPPPGQIPEMLDY